MLDYNDSVDTTAVSINGDIADARIDENGDVYVSNKTVTDLTQIVVTRTIKIQTAQVPEVKSLYTL